MAKENPKFTNILDTEMFGDDKEQYYLDIRIAKNERHYLQITKRRQQTPDTYKRTSIVLFEEELPFFIEAITMLLGRQATGNLGISC